MILAPDRGRRYSSEALYRLIDKISKEYPIRKKRRVLAGVSAGALVGRWFLLERPSFWKAAIFIAAPTQEKWTATADVSHFPPVLFVHGEKDNQFPIEEVVEHVETLKRRGVRVELFRYPDAGHEHRPEWNQVIFDWIEKNAK